MNAERISPSLAPATRSKKNDSRPSSRPLRTKKSCTHASEPWRTTPTTSWSSSSMEIICWRSRTVLSAWMRSRRAAARSNFVSSAAVSISRVSWAARSSFLPSRKRSTSFTVRA